MAMPQAPENILEDVNCNVQRLAAMVCNAAVANKVFLTLICVAYCSMNISNVLLELPYE